MAEGSAPATPSGFAIPHQRDWAEMRNRATFIRRGMLLEMAVRLSLRVPGNIVEFGVASGASTRVIKRALRTYGAQWYSSFGRKRIFALDSFEGLRESFEGAAVGTFAGSVPRISGVRFVKGYFEETCTEELRREVGRVPFAHLDADLYSSTKHVLGWLTPMLGTGSLLLFDEFIGGEMAEARAFLEWKEVSGLELIRIAEVDRDPSGYGTNPDRRLLFQVIGQETLQTQADRNSFAWKLSYYLGRLGLHELKSRLDERI